MAAEIRRSAPMAWLMALMALGCAGAAEGGGVSDDAPALEAGPDAPQAKPVRMPELKPPPAEPVVQWRTCADADDCELRGSICAPLELSGPGVCREARAPEGAACKADANCELGLYCRGARGAMACRPCLKATGPGPDEVCNREPLSCDPDERGAIDAGCEVMPD
jgi:hypothetical protein